MYDPSAVNDVANYIVLVAAIPAAIFTVLYGILAPWYRTWLGATLFGLIASIAAVLTFVMVRRWLGDFPGYEWWAIGVYSTFLFFMLSFIAIFIVERRRAGLLVFPIRRREGKDAP